MKNPKHKLFVEKSVGAALSAIKIYNKPDFKYREETFAILMINAWELLLKAKIIKENDGQLKSIYILTNKTGKKGNILKTRAPELNRSNNPKTIGLPKCLSICEQEPIRIDNAVKENIFLLMEIRDTAIHFQHSDKDVGKKVFEIGTASLKNYLKLITDWFSYDLSRYIFFLMPMTFFHEFEAISSTSINSNKEQIKNLLKYIAEKEKLTPSDETKEYNITLKLETKFVKSTETDSLLVHYSDSPDALQINVTEEDALKGFPFDYPSLTAKLRERYTDFKANQTYHNIRKPLMSKKKYCKTRSLDPNNSKSPKKDYYSSEIIKEFDKRYTKI
ncbi:MAG: DUF3644 domain-containing protein [Prevotellaceae bacterium]|jgi:hypothetical protein|nr:DUF3644 domain-containing protein [Prevotellaceae bacterium]